MVTLCIFSGIAVAWIVFCVKDRKKSRIDSISVRQRPKEPEITNRDLHVISAAGLYMAFKGKEGR